MKNVISATSDLADAHVFDYQYTTSSGKNSKTHRFSVVAIESDSQIIPRFSLRPSHLFDRIGAVIGFEDINFDSHPAFSGAFTLKGEDEDAIRALFDPHVLDFFEQRKGVMVEGSDGILIYQHGRRPKKPEEVRDYMKDGFSVFEVLAERLRRS